MSEDQSVGVVEDSAAIDALGAVSDWSAALKRAQALAEATGAIAPLTSLAQLARQAGQKAALADVLYAAVQFPAPPDQSRCQSAVLVTYELGRLDEAVIASQIGLAAFPKDPVLTAYGCLAMAQRRPESDKVAALRTAFLAHPAQYGSFYAGYAHVMTSVGLIDEAIADLTQASAAVDQIKEARISGLGIKTTLFQMLYDHGRLDLALPLLLELLDADIQHLQTEFENKAVRSLIQHQSDGLNMSAFKEPAQNAWSFLKAALSGQASTATPPTISALVFLVAKSLRYIELSTADFATINADISEDFFRIAVQGPTAVARHLRAGIHQQAWHTDTGVSDRVKDILDTVSLQTKRVLSPFTGKTTTTVHMLSEECFLLNDNGRIALVAQWAETDVTFADTIYILPEQGVVLHWRGTNLSFETVAKKILDVFKGIAARPNDVARLVNDECRGIGVAEFVCPHIGHYIWNCISGWEPFFAYGGGDKANFYAVQRDCQTLGSVGVLYADKVGGPDRVVQIDRRNTVQSIVLERHAMVLTIKHDHVSEGLAQRVVAWSYDRIAPEPLEKIRRFRLSSTLVCLVTLRLDNRCWVDQQDAWPPLLRELSSRYSGIGFIFDGINCDNVQGWTHSYMSAASEMALAQHIIQRCPGVRIYNAINCSLAESFVLGDMADFFLAPVGAGMAKYRWISNLPGVAFSNTSFSQPTSRDGRLYDKYRDNAKKAVHIPGEKITDVEAAHAVGFRANFRLDWQDLLPLVVDQCDAILANSASATMGV